MYIYILYIPPFILETPNESMCCFSGDLRKVGSVQVPVKNPRFLCDAPILS